MSLFSFLFGKDLPPHTYHWSSPVKLNGADYDTYYCYDESGLRVGRVTGDYPNPSYTAETYVGKYGTKNTIGNYETVVTAKVAVEKELRR